uniref:AAA domain-containing protein n=1 Tax=Mesocestoides corti TaxID=53468 RepID=A0A5K3EPQ7_MESCO
MLSFIMRSFYSPLYSERVLELNASDERGIAVIREKVKNFAKLATGSVNSTTGETSSIPPYKLVVLDEADSMTAPAQAALRRTMETDMKSTRFCLTCNYVTRIIGPISSRCAKFRFRPLDNEVAVSRLRYIADCEKLGVSDETLNHLLDLCDGDLRQSITLLQSASRFVAPLSIEGFNEPVPITSAHLDELASVIPEKFEEALVSAAKGRNFEKIQLTIKEIIYEGFSALQLVSQLQSRVLKSTEISDLSKQKILDAIAEADACMVEGADEYLQLLSVGGQMIKALS